MPKLHKDGLARDLKRWKIEAQIVWIHWQPELARFEWRRPWRWFHLTTNLAVEAAEVAHWLVGHVVILQTGAILALAGLLLWS